MTPAGPVDPPRAPGRLGEAIPAADLLTYLAALERWAADRRAELDRLDTASRQTDKPEAFTSDVVLAMTMWQAIRGRLDRLVEVWDSGRADAVAREQMSQLIWGRLDAGQGSALVSLVEAVTLCDAMLDQLRDRLAFDPGAADEAARLRAVRAAIVRCEDLAADDEARARVGALRAREQGISTQAARGADVGGPLGELEVEVATTERDLIVDVSQRRTLARQRSDAEALRDALEDREPTLHALAERCRREVVDPPNLAVPDVSRLGDVPPTRSEVDAFVERLRTVQRAFDAVADAYGRPLRERAELRYRLEGLRAAADANGRSASPTVRSGYDEAREAVERTPCDVVLARFYVEQYEFLTRDVPAHGPKGATR
ncbi:hypothetical protein [Cellulomonas persica]|uniref:Uncharacterized protein n=1 Tax=Cellulomonas persica TaxID=76861 RepID=A0A510UQ15_9CELL|nr:hypothetical protein [Cellulomonas persica]GEK16752.1 hypothetical protein CPE01_04850 [Cellulomonas persica]